jgi:hypothetical protein
LVLDDDLARDYAELQISLQKDGLFIIIGRHFAGSSGFCDNFHSGARGGQGGDVER